MFFEAQFITLECTFMFQGLVDAQNMRANSQYKAKRVTEKNIGVQATLEQMKVPLQRPGIPAERENGMNPAVFIPFKLYPI